jgi:hypothetical protein
MPLRVILIKLLVPRIHILIPSYPSLSFFFLLAFICAIQVAVDVAAGLAFPVALEKHPRGHYVETIDMMVGKQCTFFGYCL